MLDLSGNNLDKDKSVILSTGLHNIDMLEIRECHLTTPGMESIANAIKDLSAPVSL